MAITLKDAIAIGKAITGAANRISDIQNPQEARHLARGACIYALDNFWHDVLPMKIKEKLNNNKSEFYKLCDWPN